MSKTISINKSALVLYSDNLHMFRAEEEVTPIRNVQWYQWIEQQFINSKEFNNLVDLNLPKNEAEILVSPLKNNGICLRQILKPVIKKRVMKFFLVFYQDERCYCNYVKAVFDAICCIPFEWSLLIDRSTKSFKAVLHNRNKFPPLPLADTEMMLYDLK